jgi:hypothetical protein
MNDVGEGGGYENPACVGLCESLLSSHCRRTGQCRIGLGNLTTSFTWSLLVSWPLCLSTQL